MGKKKIFGIVLFLVLGLVMFTFANPKDETDKKLEENSQSEQQPTTENQSISEISDETTQDSETSIIPTTNQPENTPINNINNVPKEETIPVIDNEISNNEKVTAIDDKEVSNNEDEKLDVYKQNKKVEIKEYLNSLNLENQGEVEILISNNNQRIDNATSKEEIDQITAETKKSLDELKNKEILEKLKEEKIKEIKEYKNNYTYNDDNYDKYIESLNKIVKEITNSESKEDVLEIFVNGKNLIDKLIEEDLNAYKLLKIKEIVEYKEQFDWNNSYEDLANIVLNTAKEYVNKVQTKNLVDSLIEEAKEKLDFLNNNQKLEEYKKIKNAEIEEYNNNEIYSDKNQKLINQIKESAKDLISNANNIDEIDQIVAEIKSKLNDIQKLTETKFNVTFIDFNNKVIKTEEVLYGNSANAPSVKDITSKSILYSFDKWDKDFNEIKSELVVKAIYKIEKIYANIYELREGLSQPNEKTKYSAKDYTKIGSIELKITDKLQNIINKGKTVNITTDEQEIKNMVIGTLPKLDKQNYKYNYYVLKFEKGDGFHIDASQIIDEEELAKNTVTITYQLDGSLADCVMENNQTTIVSTVTTGKNKITKLPKVYKDGKEYAVVWKDSDNNVISDITVGSVNLKDNEKTYTKSTTITASIDRVGPELTLNGDLNMEVEFSSTNDYVEPGYYAVDNFDGDISNRVITTITYNNLETNKINYDVPGIYVIKYNVVDTQGNNTIKTRIITVVDPIKEVKAGIYLLNDGITRPSADARLNSDNYTKIGEVNLIIDKVRKYINGDVQVVSTNNIASYIIGGEKSLISIDSKYYYYEYYVLKYENDGFHIDCEKMFDSQLYKSDKLKELKELLENDYTKYEDEKTFETYNKLIEVINKYKNEVLDDINEIEQAIVDIKNAINSLEDIKLIELNLSNNNDEYFVNQQMKTIIVTAIYNDTTRNKVLKEDEYMISESFNSRTVGKKNIIYTYQNINATYNYTVNYSNNDLHNIISNIDINLETKIDFDKHGLNKTYFMNFNNLNSEINVVNIEVKKKNRVLRTIDLSNRMNNSFILTADDYNQIKNNNTMVSGKVIVITYMINNQYVSVEYYEAINNLYML